MHDAIWAATGLSVSAFAATTRRGFECPACGAEVELRAGEERTYFAHAHRRADPACEHYCATHGLSTRVGVGRRASRLLTQGGELRLRVVLPRAEAKLARPLARASLRITKGETTELVPASILLEEDAARTVDFVLDLLTLRFELLPAPGDQVLLQALVAACAGSSLEFGGRYDGVLVYDRGFAWVGPRQQLVAGHRYYLLGGPACAGCPIPRGSMSYELRAHSACWRVWEATLPTAPSREVRAWTATSLRRDITCSDLHVAKAA